MTLPAGKRDTRIVFERGTVVTDDHGEDVSTWNALATRWAAVLWGRGDERREAAREGGSQPATFVTLADEITRTVVLTDRIVGAGGTWDIKGIAPRARAEIEFSAVRAG